MNMFPHTVTVYNTAVSYAPDFSEREEIHAAILHGVFMDEVKAVNVNKSGLETADAVYLYIPRSIHATDASGNALDFVPPQRYWELADKSGYWTLSVKGNGGMTYFVKGEFLSDNLDAVLSHDDCYTVTKVDNKDFGGAMSHWKVGGV